MCLDTVFRWVAPPRVIASFPDENASMRLKIAGGKVGALHSHKCLQALGLTRGNLTLENFTLSDGSL